MTETTARATKRASWIIWMHIAGVGYAVAVWLLVLGLFFGALAQGFIIIGAIALTVGTLAFVGGWGRYLTTK